MADEPVRVLIADDHRLMREGTAALLASDERIEVVGLAADGAEAIALAERRRPTWRCSTSTCRSVRRHRGVRRYSRALARHRGADSHRLRAGAGPLRLAAGGRRRLPAQGHRRRTSWSRPCSGRAGGAAHTGRRWPTACLRELAGAAPERGRPALGVSASVSVRFWRCWPRDFATERSPALVDQRGHRQDPRAARAREAALSQPDQGRALL